MSGCLLDTDISIGLMRGRNAVVPERLATTKRKEVAFSAVTVAELFFGALRSQNPSRPAPVRDFSTGASSGSTTGKSRSQPGPASPRASEPKRQIRTGC